MTVQPGDPILRTFTIGLVCPDPDEPITSDEMNGTLGRRLEEQVAKWRVEHSSATVHFISGGLQNEVGQWTLWYTEPSTPVAK